MINVEVNRIRIALHGVSSQLVETAVTGLEEELRRRLGTVCAPRFDGCDISELSLPAIRTRGHLDAAALRGLLAERLTAAIMGRSNGAETD